MRAMVSKIINLGYALHEILQLGLYVFQVKLGQILAHLVKSFGRSRGLKYARWLLACRIDRLGGEPG